MGSGGHRVRAVLFDLDGTLLKTCKAPVVMRRLLEHLGIHRPLEEVSRAYREVEEGLDPRDLPTLLDEFYVRLDIRILEKLHVRSNTRGLAEFIAAHWLDYAAVGLYPDAVEVLPLLKERGLRIGLVTNALRSDLDKILPEVGLHGFFDAVVMIDTLGKMKPDQEVFLHALHELGVSPSEAVFVGDEVEADYEGALRAGLTAFLIDREGMAQDESLDSISSLRELLDLNILK